MYLFNLVVANKEFRGLVDGEAKHHTDDGWDHGEDYVDGSPI
jgi:hypothetical protein